MPYAGLPEGATIVEYEGLPPGAKVIDEPTPFPSEEGGLVGFGGDMPAAVLQPEDTQAGVRMMAEGATLPLYSIPYAGPGLAGAAATVAGRGVDLLYGTPSKEPFAAELAKNVALGYTFKGAEKIVGKAYKAAQPFLSPIENRISSTIKNAFTKAIRPSISGKANAAQSKAYFGKVQSAVESIVENKQSLQYVDDVGNAIKGELPQSLGQFSQAIDQTKRSIFKQYDDIIKSAGDDIAIPLDDISKELMEFSGGKVNQLFGGRSSAYALEKAELYGGQRLSLAEAQEAISVLNTRLNAFYKNPTVETASSAAVDAMTANGLRRAIDKSVEGSGYQALKNQYGALRSIEKEVSNRAMVDARKNIKGLIDFTDIFTAAEAARALSTMNPASAGVPATMKAMQLYYKHLNNPNRIVKNMFKDTEKLVAKRVPEIIPPAREAPGSWEMKPGLGLEESKSLYGLGKSGRLLAPEPEIARGVLPMVESAPSPLGQAFRDLMPPVPRELGQVPRGAAPYPRVVSSRVDAVLDSVKSGGMSKRTAIKELESMAKLEQEAGRSFAAKMFRKTADSLR